MKKSLTIILLILMSSISVYASDTDTYTINTKWSDIAFNSEGGNLNLGYTHFGDKTYLTIPCSSFLECTSYLFLLNENTVRKFIEHLKVIQKKFAEWQEQAKRDNVINYKQSIKGFTPLNTIYYVIKLPNTGNNVQIIPNFDIPIKENTAYIHFNLVIDNSSNCKIEIKTPKVKDININTAKGVYTYSPLASIILDKDELDLFIQSIEKANVKGFGDMFKVKKAKNVKEEKIFK